MGNCLKTQLKESVNNDSLNYLGYLKFYYVPSVAEQLMQLYGTGKVRLENAVFVDNNSAEKDLSTTVPTNIGVSGGNLTIAITDPNKDVAIIFPKYTIDIVISYRTKMNIADFAYSSVSNVLLRGDLVGNIASFETCTSLTSLQIQQTGINGNIASLSTLVGLTTLIVSSTSVSGDLVDLCNKMEVNRTSGKMTFISNNLVTLNGTAIANGVTKYIKFGTNLPEGAEYTGTGYAIYATDPDA